MTQSEAYELYKSRIDDYRKLSDLLGETEKDEVFFESLLEVIPNDLLSNQQFLLDCVKYNSLIFHFLSADLKNDINFILSVIDINPCLLFDNFNKSFLTSPKFIEKINHYIKTENGYFMKFTNSESQKDRDLILKGLKTSEYAFKYAHTSVKSDYEFVVTAASVNGLILRYYCSDFIINSVQTTNYHDNFYFDRNLTLTAVKNCGIALKFVAPQFKKDKEIIKAAIKQNKFAENYNNLESE